MRILLVTEMRSGSTLFLQLLREAPGVQVLGEFLCWTDARARARLQAAGVDELLLRHRVDAAVDAVFARCAAPVCIGKVHPEHVVFPATLTVAAAHVDRIVTLRRNVSTRVASLRRALWTGHWEASPRLQRQRRIAGDAVCEKVGCWKDRTRAKALRLDEALRTTVAWFSEAKRLRLPRLDVRSEAFFAEPDAEMRRVLRFLNVHANVSVYSAEEALGARMVPRAS